MKRAKIMLVAIAVLATVGGALAFNAQKIGNTKYCFTTTDEEPPQEPGVCPIFTANASFTTQISPVTTYYYTTTVSTDPDACLAVTTCTSVANLIEL